MATRVLPPTGKLTITFVQVGHVQKIYEAKTKSETDAGRSLTMISAKSRAQLSIKLHNTHAVAKQGRPFNDYIYLSELDEAKGLDVGTAYRNVASFCKFLESIAAAERQKTKDFLVGTKFVSLTCDGTTDVTARSKRACITGFRQKEKLAKRFVCFGTPSRTTSDGIQFTASSSSP